MRKNVGLIILFKLNCDLLITILTKVWKTIRFFLLGNFMLCIVSQKLESNQFFPDKKVFFQLKTS